MPSKSSMQGIGTGIGTLIGAFLRGREEEQYERKLKELLEQQRRDVEAAQLGAGTMQGPPRPVMPPAVQPDRSFGEMLMGIPGQIGAGLTPSSPAIYGLEQQYKTGGEELERARTISDMLTAARLKGQLPLEQGRREELGILGTNAEEVARLRAKAEIGKETYRQGEMNRRAAERNKVLGAGRPPGFNERLYNQMTPEQQKAYMDKLTGMGPKPPPSDVSLLDERRELEREKRDFATNLNREKNPLKGDEAVVFYQSLKSNIDLWNSRHPELWVDLPPYSPEIPGTWVPWKSGTPAKFGPGAAPVTPPVALPVSSGDTVESIKKLYDEKKISYEEAERRLHAIGID